MRGSKSQTVLARRALSVPYSSLPADRFDTETSGRFSFTCYRCVISYRSEILAPVTRAGTTFCGGSLGQPAGE